MANWRKWRRSLTLSSDFNMARILHIVTRPGDSLAQEIIAQQKTNLANQVELVDLTTTKKDYRELLEKIFAADSVETW